MDPTVLINRAKKKISRFCMDECHAYCCRKGSMKITDEEFDLVTHSHGALRPEKGADGKFSLFFQGHCPALTDDNMCMVHKDKKRPRICSDFPIFLIDGNVAVSKDCTAVMQGILFPYLKELQMAGYRIAYF